MMKILNLTQHATTPDQVAAGVVEPDRNDGIDKDIIKNKIRTLLTFTAAPTSREILERSTALARIARQWAIDEGGSGLTNRECGAMIGGAGFLMGPLELALSRAGIRPFHSFTLRVPTEEILPDGSVRKGQTFRHLGWVESVTIPSAQGFTAETL